MVVESQYHVITLEILNLEHCTDEELKKHGLYPNAIEIPSSVCSFDFGSIEKDGKLHIQLTKWKGYCLCYFEIMVGDTIYDRTIDKEDQKNKDGFYGKLGGAKLNAFVNGDYMIYNGNVPPQGVLSGGPSKSNYVVKESDQIIVESKRDKTWIMGFRIVFR
jgi:hypothetical protein